LWWTRSINNSFSITNTSFPDSIEIAEIGISVKAEPSMNWTFRGITIDWSDDWENANDLIRVNREFDSNVIDESDLQDEKHDEPRIWTVEGIIIDRSDENENAFDSIRVNREFDSNIIDESDSQ
jgi:hypothetical protein